MSERYDHAAIERKWQKIWRDSREFETPDTKEGAKNFYLLTEFAYPSGNLHLGHWYAFAVPDIFARYMRMRGYNVLYPAGFDAFGLPAENAAIKNNRNPREWTYNNIEQMRTQQCSIGASFDWSREVITADPAYYKWTQWLFLKLFERGLAYRKETNVNWCPNDKTVLANEQVINGRCERCDSEVVQKTMPQWNLKITDYADRLIDDLASLDWPKQIKDAQIHWIGRSEGVEIDFPLSSGGMLTVFTTRPDTLFGATYMVVAPEHPLVSACTDAQVRAYVEKAKHKTELERTGTKDKTGVALPGVKAVNPATNKEIPIWVADYVLMGYGTGAIMAVPDIDERDKAFAEAMGLPIGQTTLEDADKVVALVGGRKKKQYRLRDWVVSRQRYWGVPIPMIHCKDCGYQPVPERDLPVLLPDLDDYLPTGEGKSPLAKKRDWVEVTCPSCGKVAERESDTLDTFVDSSWYFLRYTDPHNETAFASKDKLSKWLPVHVYSGGSEHTTMHLLYSRFWHKAMFDAGLVAESEPYLRRMNRGLILGPDGRKMSKRWGNVINPDDEVTNLGADTVRMYLAFIGPYNEAGSYPWNPRGAVGMRRFLERVWHLQVGDAPLPHKTETLLHQTIKKVSEDIESLKMNTAVSALMILLNEFESVPHISREAHKTLLQLLAPFAPHIANELAEKAGYSREAWERWPVYDEAKIAEARLTIAVQINGKTRATVELEAGANEADVVAAARAHPNVQKWLAAGEGVVRYVPGRIISFTTT